jgi:O-antigen/teichoic acid export membrane protein
MSVNLSKIIDSRKIVYLDQAVVSGTNFITALILARVLGIVEFGVYSLFFIILIFILSVHHSLFGAPMFVIAPKISGQHNQRSYLFTLNSIQIFFCLILAILVGLAGIALSTLESLNFDTSILIPFGICVFFSPIQEWLRRFFLVLGETSKALYVDVTRCLLQTGGILGLVYFDSISVWSTYVAIAFSSICTYFLFIVLYKVRMDFSQVSSVWCKNWKQGRFLLPVNVMEWINSQGYIILASFVLGPLAAGAIKAAMNVMGPLNILYQAVENIYPVEGARHLKATGRKGMITYFKKMSFRSLFYFVLPCLVMGLFAKQIMVLLYGEAFSSYYMLVVFHLISLILCYYYKILSSLLRVLDLTHAIFIAMIFGTVIIAFLSAPVAAQYSKNGVMILKNIAEFVVFIFLLVKVRAVLSSAEVRGE